MYGDTDRGGASSALHFVTCDLSSLTDCACLTSVGTSNETGSSASRRKNRTKPSPHIDPDCLTPNTAKRIYLERPSLVDRLILQSRSVLEEMEGKKRGSKSLTTTTIKPKADVKEGLKRKCTESLDGLSPAVKRLRSSKAGGSDSDSSEIVTSPAGKRRGRPPRDPLIDKKSSANKKLKEKSRFSKRICFSTSSLRSGKKRNELLKLKRKVKNLGKDPKDGRKKWSNNDRTDSNSNVFTENDSNEEPIDGSTDSEMSRGPFEPPDIVEQKTEKRRTQEEEGKKRKKRRKRDSMWVKRVKKQIKAKVDVSETLLPPPPSLAVENVIEPEVSEIPILDKENNDTSNLENTKEKSILSSPGSDDVAMPKLEKEVEIDVPSDKSISKEILSPPGKESETNQNPLVCSKDPSVENNLTNEGDLNRLERRSPDLDCDDVSSKINLSSTKKLIDEDVVHNEPSPDKTEVNHAVEESIGNVDITPDAEDLQYDEFVVKLENASSKGQPGRSSKDLSDIKDIQQNKSDYVQYDNNLGDTLENNLLNIPKVLKKERLESELNNSETEIQQNICVIESVTGGHIKSDDSMDTSPQESSDIGITTDVQCETTNVTLDSSADLKDVSLLDADSTSDVKPQSLDDSFTDFSLSLPEDLELESSPSDDEKDEESDRILPDSTECGQKDEKESASVGLIESNDETIRVPIDSQDANESSNEIEEIAPTTASVNETTQECKTAEPIADQSPNDQTPPSVRQEEDHQKPAHDPPPPNLKNNDGTIETNNEEPTLTVEEQQMKESVLLALGLQSLNNQPEEKPKKDGYTGTLKAVIKLNRSGDKNRMVYQRSEDLEYRICSEVPATEGVPITHLNDIAGIRKNVAKLHHESDMANHGSTTSNGHSVDHEASSNDESKGASNAKESNLIIPEKSSSFSIHPGRLCSDVCSYCFGKFGCLDTPCHVAQLKAERQKKIFENETHLTAESCLCDACYRYVDRRANCPSKSSGSSSNKSRVKPPASSQCCVNHCTEQATHTVKKKWLIKLKKSITNKLDIDLDKHSSMYIPLCSQHHYWVDYFTVCGICRKRLNRNHLYSLGSETDRLNLMLAEDGIPARLSDKLFLCKLCRYYSNLRLKYTDPSSIPSSGQIFYRSYRRKILMSLDIAVSDSEDEPLAVKEEKKKTSNKPVHTDTNGTTANGGGTASTSNKTDESVVISNLATLLGDQPEQQARIQVKFGNVNIGRLSNLNIGQGGSREERLPYSDVGLQANLEFQGPAVPDGSWERCTSNIQFDKRTKKLWQDLQKPYGNQSSFLRHLVMLEKYWRAGYLVLAPGSDEGAAKYLNGVKNRIKSFEGSSSSEKPTRSQNHNTPATPVSSNEQFPLITNTGEIEITPIISQKKPVVQPTMPVVVANTAPPPPPPEKKQLTPLDRAKALVRMVPPTSHHRYSAPPVQPRYQVPMYVQSYGGYQSPQQQHHRPPPLLKIRNKMLGQTQYYASVPQQIQLSSSTPNLRPILPKLPNTLTVTHLSQSGPAAITLNRSGITIEKQTGSQVTPSLPIEKPSISVFREPAPGPPI